MENEFAVERDLQYNHSLEQQQRIALMTNPMTQ